MTGRMIVGIAAAAWLASASVGLAQAPLNASLGMADNLRALAAGKTAVTVVLKGGQTYSGKIGSVGDHQVLLTELAGKEFFDALIDLEEIAALEARARKP